MRVPPHAHCRVRVSASRSAVPRIVSVLHARGLALEHLHVDGRELCLAVRGAAASRLPALLGRVVDVHDVELTATCLERPVLPTRYVVLRSPKVPA